MKTISVVCVVRADSVNVRVYGCVDAWVRVMCEYSLCRLSICINVYRGVIIPFEISNTQR